MRASGVPEGDPALITFNIREDKEAIDSWLRYGKR
jgi:hypothetical protein